MKPHQLLAQLQQGHPVPAAARMNAAPAFTAWDADAEIAVLVVTYNNERDLPTLLASLRQETAGQRIKVVVADNSPSSATLEALEHYPDVLAFSTGGNLGYAGAINVALQRAGSAEAYLVLNPDLRVEAGAILALRRNMARTGAGVVVPMLANPDGSIFASIRREPGIIATLGDAFMGSRFSSRPGWLSETDFNLDSYSFAHPVDWATGAALLIRADVAERVGSWDERYFLYSEETDFMRRVRASGATIWFEPNARMTHSGGGSGASPDLEALMGVNRIRYIRKFHRSGYAEAFRAAVVLSALLRAALPGRRTILAYIARESTWKQLPRAASHGDFRTMPLQVPPGAVIIPAHNEAAVLRRTLTALEAPLASSQLEVIVVCNGCTDDTENVARSFAGVRVICIETPSKAAALNAGDRAATLWPRLYLDADIELPVQALCASMAVLGTDSAVLCARPAFRYATEGTSWLVRSYYRARNRLPQSSASMWGAGVYGLSLKGHLRLGEFPPLTADDCFIDRLFNDTEKAVLSCPPVTVRTPRSCGALLATLKRIYRGNSALRDLPGGHTGRTLKELSASIHGPGSAVDAIIYGVFALAGRLAPRPVAAWERDETSRKP